MNRKTTQFKQLLQSHDLDFLLEAHNGLSAKIVEEAGFKGIWASGLCISASLGVRDNNEASWTQVLEVLEFMSDATTIPILVDADTGYGNFNNAATQSFSSMNTDIGDQADYKIADRYLVWTKEYNFIMDKEGKGI